MWYRNVKKFKLIFFLRRVVARFFNGPCTLNLVLPLHVPQKPAVLALNAVDLTGIRNIVQIYSSALSTRQFFIHMKLSVIGGRTVIFF
jgi:hypothetical protein